MMGKKTTLLIPILFCGLSAVAQFSDSVHHYVNFASTGIINRTNDGSSYVLTNGVKFNVNKKDAQLNSNTSWIYGQQQQKLTNNDFISTLDFNLSKTFPHFYYWGLGSFEKSYSLKINHRLQAGLGAAYNVIDKPNTNINISNGVLYENSNLKINDSTNTDYRIFRNSFRFRYHFVINDVIVFDGMHFIQNSLSDREDYILKSINSLTFKVRKWLGLTTAATYNRTQQTRSENLLITFGLTAEKYF